MPELRKTKYILAYLEIVPQTCDVTDPNTLTRVQRLYSRTQNYINALQDVFPHPLFSVKIFSSNLIFADEVVYHPDDDNEELVAHNPQRSLLALWYFVSYFQYQALIEYGWLIQGAVTCGSLYLTPNEGVHQDQRIGQNQMDTVDFVWGGALVRGYSLQKKEIYPRIIIDTEVNQYIGREFPQQLPIFQYPFTNSTSEYPSYVNYAATYNWTKSQRLARVANRKILGKVQNLIEHCNDNDLRRMYEWTRSYLQDVREMGVNYIHPDDPKEIPDCLSTTNSGLETYYIAYLDFLGTEKKIQSEESTTESHERERWLNAIDDVYKQSLIRLRNLYPSLQIKTKIFSDNVIIAIKDSDPVNDILSVSSQLATLVSYFQIYALLKYRWLLRGCITKGQLYMDDIFIWGPAVIRALYLENNIAKNPRLLIDIENFDTENDKILIEHLYPQEDPDDEMWFVGYQNIMSLGSEYISVVSNNSFQNGTGFLQSCHDVLAEMFEEYRDTSVRDKVLWAIKYHNRICADEEEGGLIIPLEK
ncbi:MAG: hypothetical protein O0X93_08805 [Methanocorpusculum sp.]|nr:hypothetical protein [Methanocorpusculum sp.]